MESKHFSVQMYARHIKKTSMKKWEDSWKKPYLMKI